MRFGVNDFSECDAHCYIYNNTITGCSDTGIKTYRFSGTYTVYIKNNIITGCGVYGLDKVISRCHMSIDYNCWDNNGTDVHYTSFDVITKGAHAVSSDPLFAEASPGTDEDDYRLQSIGGRWTGSEWTKDVASSPCIDTGDPAFDYSNEPSPNGGRINIGFDGNTTYASKAVGEGSSAYEYYYRYLMST